jgi:7-carboxy-7-deazaguanine synthase
VITEWIQKYDFQIKFVVSGESDIKEIKDLLSRLPPTPFHQVLLMPEGIDARTLASRASWLVEVCKREGFRYCPRLQIELFGHTRGT